MQHLDSPIKSENDWFRQLPKIRYFCFCLCYIMTYQNNHSAFIGIEYFRCIGRKNKKLFTNVLIIKYLPSIYLEKIGLKWNLN